MTTRYIARTGIIAAIYVAITFVFAPISYGQIQVRLAESLTLLPMIMPEAVLGLFIGCLLANLMGPWGIVDIVFGSLTTLVAAYITYRFRHTYIAYLSPILLNAFGVSLYLYAFFQIPYWITVFYIAAGQSVAVLALGIPLLRLVKKHLPQQ
ncbi:MAG TPA: QueT transporter family protein [Firmicutes bacterium]|nr:QueT transporter family protein [Bacillota bacterium]